jgi:hypothetical protein
MGVPSEVQVAEGVFEVAFESFLEVGATFEVRWAHPFLAIGDVSAFACN